MFITHRFQLLKDCITCLPENDKAKEDMLAACRQYYRGNYRVLQMIDEFERDYHADDCISWFTRETFLYQLINKALRTQDVEQLFIFRFYITDLSKKLLSEHKMIGQLEGTIYLYRGTLITKDEAQIIRNNLGKLFATNCYWSTSLDRLYATTFARKVKHRPDMISVLFQIKCDSSDENNSIIFANISNCSVFQEEKEFLFDLGATFTIEQIHEEMIDDANLLVITIVANGKGREILQKYIEQNRQEMEFESPTILLCNLLKRMGKAQQSFQLLQYLMKNPGSENLAHIHTRIGIALKEDDNYHHAFEHFRIALQLTLDASDSSQQKYLPVILLNQGLLYARMNQLDQAFQFYGEVQELLKNEFYYNSHVLAHLYSCMGRVYSRKNNFFKAFHYFFKSSVIQEKHLPPGHVVFANHYEDIATIYSRQNKCDEAIKYHLQALEIRKKTSPDNHYLIASSTRQIGSLYQRMSNTEVALQYYLQSLNIYRQHQSNSSLIKTLRLLDDIILIHDGQFELSLQYQLEASNIQRQIQPINYIILANRLSKIASIYNSINNVNDSIKYHQEAREIRRKYHQEAREIRRKYRIQNARNSTCQFH